MQLQKRKVLNTSCTLNGKAPLKIRLIISLSCPGKLPRHNNEHQHAGHSSRPKRQLRCVAILIRGWSFLKGPWAFLLGMPHSGFGHHIAEKDLIRIIRKGTTEMTWKRVWEALRLKAESRKTLPEEIIFKMKRERGQEKPKVVERVASVLPALRSFRTRGDFRGGRPGRSRNYRGSSNVNYSSNLHSTNI